MATTAESSPVARTLPREPQRRRPQPCFGALDLGTNNCRLLIARGSPEDLQIVDAYSRVVRLGEGLIDSGALSGAAQDRALAALQACSDKLRRRGVALARSVATEACRHASNGPEFVTRVYAETGIALDVITPEEEARLAVLGCQGLIDPAMAHAIVFDIGGGSTEISAVRRKPGGELQTLGWLSVPLGVVSLWESTPHDVHDETARVAAYARMVATVSAWVRPFAARLKLRGDGQLLGASGTITTLAGVLLGLVSYDRKQVDGAWVDIPAMRALSARLARGSLDERAGVPCIGAERAELVVAGCAILEAILDAWPGRRLRVADRGIREGILRTLAARSAGTLAMSA